MQAPPPPPQQVRIPFNPEFDFARFGFVDAETYYNPNEEARKFVPPSYFEPLAPVNPLFYAKRQEKTPSDGAIEFDIVSGLRLTHPDYKGFRVYPVVNEVKPVAFLAEATFTAKIFQGLYRFYKGSKDRQQMEEATLKKLENNDKRKAFMDNQKELDLGITYYVLQDAVMGITHYILQVSDKIPPTIRLRTISADWFQTLMQMSLKREGTTTQFQNMCHIINYMADTNFATVEKDLFLQSTRSKGMPTVTNRHYYASLVLTDDSPVIWFCFTIRTVKKVSALLLHGWAYSLMGIAIQDQGGMHKGKRFRGIGPTALSMLVNIAAVLNGGNHMHRVYLQALAGTEQTITSMQKVISEKTGNPLGSPYLRFTNQDQKDDLRFIDYFNKRCFDHPKMLPDKLYVDNDLLNFWKYSSLEFAPPPRQPNQQEPVPPAFAEQRDDGEPPFKKQAACIECGLVGYCGLTCKME